MGTTQELRPARSERFRHEAFLYRGAEEFVDGTATFVRDCVAAGEPVLLAVSAEKGERLRDELGDDLHGHADDVLFADMADLGRNPARIIPAWHDFLTARRGDGGRVRGVGEPVWAGRSSAELLEAQRHEALLGVAFTDLDDFWLMCPYDVGALGPDVIEEAYSSHPYVVEAGRRTASERHVGAPGIPAHLDDPLDEPPAHARTVDFRAGQLSDLRRLTSAWAADLGMDGRRREMLVLAVNELTTNSVEHGGGAGRLLLWRAGGSVVAEVRDGGYIAAPLVGRIRPDQQQGGGRGVWLVNHVCDLVQIRSDPAGTVVRIRLTA